MSECPWVEPAETSLRDGESWEEIDPTLGYVKNRFMKLEEWL